MKIRMTFDFSDIVRGAIARDAGKPTKASREVVENWIKETVKSSIETAVEDYNLAKDRVSEATAHLTDADRKILLDNLLAEMDKDTKEEEPAEEEREVGHG